MKNFPIDLSLIPGFIPSCKFHISFKSIATLMNNKRKAPLYSVDVFGNYRQNSNK